MTTVIYFLGNSVDPKPEEEASGSLRNMPALYITAQCTGKRRQGRIEKGIGASQGYQKTYRESLLGLY